MLDVLEKYLKTEGKVDACSFYDEYDNKCVLEMMATLKGFNYKLMHVDFMHRHKREKLKVIYLRFLHFNRSTDSRSLRLISLTTRAKNSTYGLFIQMLEFG